MFYNKQCLCTHFTGWGSSAMSSASASAISDPSSPSQTSQTSTGVDLDRGSVGPRRVDIDRPIGRRMKLEMGAEGRLDGMMMPPTSSDLAMGDRDSTGTRSLGHGAGQPSSIRKRQSMLLLLKGPEGLQQLLKQPSDQVLEVLAKVWVLSVNKCVNVCMFVCAFVCWCAGH